MSTFTFEEQAFEAEDGETVLGALLRHKVEVRSGCRAGACQACLLRTRDKVPAASQQGLDESLVERGIFMACQTPAATVQEVERLGQEVFPRFHATLYAKHFLSDDVIHVKLRVPGWEGTPGRFIRLIAPNGISRPYSLATPAWEPRSTAQLHVRLIPDGSMSQLLLNATIGDTFDIEGPFGKCCYRSAKGNEPILMIGSGTGLAPLYAIATDALNRGHSGSISLYHGAATSSRLYFREELERLKSYSNFTYTPCADEDLIPLDRLGSPLDAAICDHVNLEGYKVYLCGHPALVRTAQRKCFLSGADLKDISADPFEPA